MPEPVAICLEDLSPRDPALRFVRCVVLGGGYAGGLSLGPLGELLWRSEGGGEGEPTTRPEDRGVVRLLVSSDEKLVLFRPDDAAPDALVHRSGRSVLCPTGRPVVLLDQDLLEVGGRRLRVHVHGPAPSVHEPSPVPAEKPPASFMRAAAAALAIGAAVSGGAGCEKPIEVRDRPPSVMPVEQKRPDAGPKKPDAKPVTPIEVRERPPIVEPRPQPPPPPPKKTTGEP
jgi:hypothetical protein